MITDDRRSDFVDVLTEVAVLGRALVPRSGEQRGSEPVNLRARVVEVILGRYVGALRAQQPGQRVADGGPPYAAQVDRAGWIGRDELEVHPLATERGPVTVTGPLLDNKSCDGPDCRRAQPDVQEAGSGDRDAPDRRIAGEPGGDGLR